MGDIEIRFDILNYKTERPLAIHKKERVLGMLKDELSSIIMRDVVGLLPKMYLHLTDDEKEEKRQKELRNVSPITC